ncbi:hypothetical protein IE53DRAFT_390583 [Violaceomyces palustris]|uniref:Uncharacterized protein n=1 Tax=Violaceomyces palustris TaxID=1673888 RepID=A0ACD0NN93_9BASI|nr:hypothetical protein IE53DRAFT_390583 [Violaceomyces palustris]
MINRLSVLPFRSALLPKSATTTPFKAIPTPAIASSSRNVMIREFGTTSAAKSVQRLARNPSPPPKGDFKSPTDFLTAISRPRRDLASNSSCVSAVGEDWDNMFRLSSEKLKGAGVGIKERRYLLWALEKYRQGYSPEEFAHDVKPKKKVRGWGARVQTAERIRVRGRRRPGEK